MTTKAINWTIIVFLLFGLGTWGCDDDDKVWVADSDPELSLTAEEIHSDQGRTIKIEGNIKDELGIKSIHLNIDEWFLDREILISSSDSLVKDYQLDYAFFVPEDAEENGHIIEVTVYNMGNRSVSQNVTIYMDGDFDAPTMTINSPVDGLTQAPDEEIPVDLSVGLSDARQLGYFIVEEANLEFRDSISYMGSGLTAANYSNTVMLPATVAEYHFTFMVADSAGNTVSSSRVVKASYDFDKLYLADVATDAQLVSDLFGVPMLISKTAPYNFEGKFYAEAPGTEIRFIPQTSSFNPHCYGLDPDDPDKLINDPERAEPIVLEEIGYYRVKLDLQNLTYSIESYEPADDYFMPKKEFPDDEDYISSTYYGDLGMVGKGFPEYPDQSWSTGASIPFDRDPENNYRFYKTLDLEGTVEMIFQPEHPWGWWPEPFWRFDRSVDPERTVPNGGDNLNMDVPERTTYKMVFDSHLNRAKAIRVE